MVSSFLMAKTLIYLSCFHSYICATIAFNQKLKLFKNKIQTAQICTGYLNILCLIKILIYIVSGVEITLEDSKFWNTRYRPGLEQGWVQYSVHHITCYQSLSISKIWCDNSMIQLILASIFISLMVYFLNIFLCKKYGMGMTLSALLMVPDGSWLVFLLLAY